MHTRAIGDHLKIKKRKQKTFVVMLQVGISGCNIHDSICMELFIGIPWNILLEKPMIQTVGRSRGQYLPFFSMTLLISLLL